MAERVTDQEKQLWINAIYNGSSIPEIIANSCRSESTIRRHTKDAIALQEDQRLQLSSENEFTYKLEYHQQDEIDMGSPYENMTESSRATHEFIDVGGVNGASLWDSDQRRSTALKLAQHIEEIFQNADVFIPSMIKHEDNINKWTQWIVPIAYDWALTEGNEEPDIAEVYGLIAALFMKWIWNIHGEKNLLGNQVSYIINQTGVVDNYINRTKTLLTIYRNWGVGIAEYLKNNLNLSQLATRKKQGIRQAYLIAYANTMIHGGDRFSDSGETILAEANGVLLPEYKIQISSKHRTIANNLITKALTAGYKAAVKDVNSGVLSSPDDSLIFQGRNPVEKFLTTYSRVIYNSSTP